MEFIDWLSISIWFLGVGIALCIFIILIWNYRNSEERTRIKLAFCLIFLCLGVARIFLVIFDYWITGLNPANYAAHQVFWRFAMLFYYAGLGFLILTSENRVFQGRDYYVFSLGYSIGIIICLLIPDFVTTQNALNYLVLFAAFIPISYVYLAIKFPITRKNIAILFIGISLFMVFNFILSAYVVVMLGISVSLLYLICASFQALGITILGVGIKRMYFTNQ